MVEDAGQVATPEAGTTETPTSFVGENGNFIENWTHILKDESLRDNPTLTAATSIEALAGMTVSAQKMVGADKIMIPNDASSETEWGEWHKAGGRPEIAADYNLARPEDLPEEHYSQEMTTAVQDLFHKLGLSQAQAKGIFDFHNGNIVTQLTNGTRDAEQGRTALEDGLYADWGNGFKQKKHDGDVAVERATAGNVEFKKRLTGKFGDDPDFIRFAAEMGKQYREAGSITAESIPTPGDNMAEINKEMGKGTAYGGDYASHGFTRQQHDDQVAKVARMFEQKSKKLTGAR